MLYARHPNKSGAAALYLGDFPEARDRRSPAAARPRLFPAVRMLQGDKGLRDLIAVTQENSLELTAGDCAIEIDIDTRKDLRLFRGINQAATLAKFFSGTRLA
jgi:CTP:molybdopterin cytidylyltransferase MocA